MPSEVFSGHRHPILDFSLMLVCSNFETVLPFKVYDMITYDEIRDNTMYVLDDAEHYLCVYRLLDPIFRRSSHPYLDRVPLRDC